MQLSLSEIKEIFRNKFGVDLFVSSLDTQHFQPHIHLKFSGEEAVINLMDFEFLAPENPKTLNKNFQKKIKNIAEFLENSREITDFLQTEFYNPNPHLKRLQK